MERKQEFTKFEMIELEKLINLKVIASTLKQKSIRNEIRAIGFHYSDYSCSKHGYTVSDLRELIKLKQVYVI